MRMRRPPEPRHAEQRWLMPTIDPLVRWWASESNGSAVRMAMTYHDVEF
jgi:hypothetical protein